jgi:alkylation response protein AidB-like acyl-CoA dehydrogenase
MQVYEAPLRDMQFVLHELHQDDGFGSQQMLAEFPPDVVDAVLGEAARLARDILLPLNRLGDEQGCVLENGRVRTPAGFKAAYDQYRDGGWCALTSDPKWGGQGLPETVNKMVEEMTCAANVSFSLYPGLTHGATTAIEGHAAEDLKNLYLPKLVAGTWSGTMCLTEAHCGTDLGLLRTRAVAQADGSYQLTGSKIFISAGEHDLTENIVHLVLARTPDAAAGIKGISLFLVPKYLVDAAGTPGSSNGVSCAGIEHKMGLKALADRQARQGHGGHVHDDEYRTCFGGRPRLGYRRGGLSGSGVLCQGANPGTLVVWSQIPRKGGRSHHRASRCAPHAHDDACL